MQKSEKGGVVIWETAPSQGGKRLDTKNRSVSQCRMSQPQWKDWTWGDSIKTDVYTDLKEKKTTKNSVVGGKDGNRMFIALIRGNARTNRLPKLTLIHKLHTRQRRGVGKEGWIG